MNALSRRLGSNAPTVADRVVLACCLALVVLVVALHVDKYTQLSPIDELQHLDYVIKAPDAVIGRGERVGQEAMRTELCRGIDAPLAGLPPCDTPGPLDPEWFQERGYNTASVHPPTYYAVTSVLARVLEPLLGLEALHTAARLVGIFWLGAGIWLVWRLLVHLGTSPVSQLALLSLLIVSPTVVLASATISPDSTAVLAGAAVVAAVWLWDEGVVGAWVPGAVTVIMLALKFTHVGAVVFAVAFLAVRSLQQAPLAAWRDSPVHRRHLRAAAVIAGSALAALMVWTVVQRVVEVEADPVIPMAEAMRATEFPTAQLFEQIDAGFSPLQNPYFTPPLRVPYLVGLNHVLDTAALLAVGSAAVFAAARSRERALAAATATAMLALGPVTVLSNYVTSSTLAVPIPPRYGLPLVSGAVVCAVPAMQRRWIRVGVTTLAAIVVALTVQRLVRV